MTRPPIHHNVSQWDQPPVHQTVGIPSWQINS